MGSQNLRAQTRGATPSAPTGNTHAPGPGGMPTGCSRYLPPWPLCTVCARKGVDNLLNRTLPTAGTSGSTKQVWGLLDKTRSTADSGGSSILCMISITKIFPLTGKLTTRQASPCHTGHDCPDGGLGTRPCLPKTEAFSSFLPVCMNGICR